MTDVARDDRCEDCGRPDAGPWGSQDRPVLLCARCVDEAAAEGALQGRSYETWAEL